MEALIFLGVLVIIALYVDFKDRQRIDDYWNRKKDFNRYHNKTFTKWWER